MKQCGIQIASESRREPQLLLWGAPVPLKDMKCWSLRKSLVQTIDQLENQSRSRSEPDVVLDFGKNGVIFIEVKYKSANDKKEAKHKNWSRYLTDTKAFRIPQKVAATGHYELARNWRIAWEFREGRPMCLINLGLSKLFLKSQGQRLQDFENTLHQDNKCSFHKLIWKDFINAIPNIPSWLNEYVTDKGLNAV
jgi:uncharacterized protein YkuJ